ncbi:cytochrome c-type biogenesis protein CcmH [Shimia isoporae]|uniref:Cytochrome c-type biogenesis protein n=1 Tax=Shimia isoporae TaxID=647720 RepID=A0A4R1NSB2_9RHOB|nr:cytochrome c-type biogenesis protein [Shimia isoporae]TCL09663.1 cytochrome c-type biogenesis protein CcmH [Shimia isoporae]
MNTLKWLFAMLVVTLAVPVWAVQPEEMLDDPVLEERAREISQDLRCLVCRNENIDDSNAELAKDLRVLVRERLTEGDTNDEVIDFVVDRYGEYVLLRPRTGGTNMVLYLAGPMMLLLALGVALSYLRGRSRAPARTEAGLSTEEQARLDEILKK